MEVDLRYYKTRGIYTFNGSRAIVFPRGSLELMQIQIGRILGLATKSLFTDAMSTTLYSFLTDLIKSKQLRLRGEDRSEDEIFTLLADLGFGRIEVTSKEPDSYSVFVGGCFNSVLPDITTLNSCFQMDGILTAAYRIILKRDIRVTEVKCKSTGNSDSDQFKIDILGSQENFNYVMSPLYDLKDQEFEQIELDRASSGFVINSMPVEIVPVIFFPYLFSILRRIVGVSVHGIEYGVGLAVSRLYTNYNLQDIALKYRVEGLGVLAPVAGIGAVKTIKNAQGSIEEIDLYDSFNSLHIDSEVEKRCFMVSGMFTGLSSKLFGSNYKLYESDCASINNSVCKFSFAWANA